MDLRFEFQQLFPDLRWEVILKMKDIELVNLCRSSHQMENFCNTKDWFWKQRITSQFEMNTSDPKFQQMLTDKGNWFRVYFTLIRLNKLKVKLSPILDGDSLLDIYYKRNLDLSYVELTELPREIGQLINLLHLNLSYTQLTELPTEIGDLVNLVNFDISSNNLTELPREIGQLVNLLHFQVSENNLTELPDEIGQLVNLEFLDLSYNQLEELPGEIGRLANLITIDLSGNNLTELPIEIEGLTKLEHLYISGNSLSTNIHRYLLPNVYIRKKQLASFL